MENNAHPISILTSEFQGAEHLRHSGAIGVCGVPNCDTCPPYIHEAAYERRTLLGEAAWYSWIGLLEVILRIHLLFYNILLGVINPHSKFFRRWSRFFVISCLVAIFVDAFFFFLPSVQLDDKCIIFDWRMMKVLVIFRSVTDFIYLLHILLQFKLAYILPESRVTGAGVLVDNPKKIACNYLRKCFWLDLAVVLPLPQIIVPFVQPNLLDFTGDNVTKNILRAVVLIQYLPRFYRFIPLLAGHSTIGFIFESAWANFIINLFTYVLAGHLVGSCWYLLGLQRVNQCLRDACHNSNLSSCERLINCGDEYLGTFQKTDYWRKNPRAMSCFDKNAFHYGIYIQAVNLTTEHSVVKRYVYSLFWGFQQISTLAGNQTPSYFPWEVLFTMAIGGLGLLLFALLIGNVQNFLQALGKRRLEMMVRRRDVDLWMSHHHLPDDLRRKVREVERYNWRGVDEEKLMANLPEDLQTSIRRHLFRILKKVPLFSALDEHVLDSISERLRPRNYISRGHILIPGDPIKKMTFIVRGIVESVKHDDVIFQMSEGNFCGEELLPWCLERSSLHRDASERRVKGQRPISKRKVRCLTNVEAFTLEASDLEEIISLFATIFHSPLIQDLMRSHYPSSTSQVPSSSVVVPAQHLQVERRQYEALKVILTPTMLRGQRIIFGNSAC